MAGYALDTDIRQLTSAIASGDAEAFASFYRDWFAVAVADARRATGRDESFCLDVVQDAMLRVIRSIRTMDTQRQLRNWLRVVVQSCAYDRLRRELRRSRREAGSALSERVQDVVDADAERLAWLRREIAGMEAPEARLMVMRYRLGWTLEAIGRAVGLRPGAVDGRIRRSTKTLRQKAREQADERTT